MQDKSLPSSKTTGVPTSPSNPLTIDPLVLDDPVTQLPDLLAIRPLSPSVIAAGRAECAYDNYPYTKPFDHTLPDYFYSNTKVPEPYNPAYPHPITAYASPGVNPDTVRASGYDKVLYDLLRTQPDLVKGTILASSDRDVSAPALMIPTQPGEGCGIPERLFGADSKVLAQHDYPSASVV